MRQWQTSTMDEHQSQNQSFTVTMNFRHQSCWNCCLWPAEGTFLNLAPICHLFMGRGKKPSGSTNSFRCPSLPPVFTTTHLAILVSRIFDRSSGRHRLHYLWNFLSQYHNRHFVLAPWSTVYWEVKNIAVFYGTRIFITVFKRVPLVPSPNQVNSVFVFSLLYVRAIWILSSHLRLHLPCLFFPSGFRLKP